MSRARFLTLALATTLLATPAWAAPFQNGSFETGPGTNGQFATLSSGDTSITGWTVLNGGIDYISGYWQHAHGNRSLDLNALAVGGIGQTFDTVAGQQYQVTFKIAGNPEGGPAFKTLDADVAGVTLGFGFDTTGKSTANMGWATQSFLFTATNSSSTLRFISTTTAFSGNQAYPNAFGPALDDVTVTDVSNQVPVPEPASLLLLGTGLLSGLRAARRRR